MFRGALDVRARDINDVMLRDAGDAIADVLAATELMLDRIVPSVFDARVAGSPLPSAPRGVAIGVARRPAAQSDLVAGDVTY